jgi:hypothetical protein
MINNSQMHVTRALAHTLTHTHTRARAPTNPRAHAHTQVLSMLIEVKKMDSRFQTFTNLYVHSKQEEIEEKTKIKDQKDEMLQPDGEINNGGSHGNLQAQDLSRSLSKTGTTATYLSSAVTATPFK